MVRSSLRAPYFAALLCVAPFVAHAQYAPHSLGIGPQLTSLVGTPSPMWGLSLEFSSYLDGGFEFFGRVPVLLAQTAVGADTPDGVGRVFATGASVGVRYLFFQGSVRPWVGLQLGGLVLVTRPEPAWFLGTGATVGLDWILTESWSVGARGIYDVYLDLNRPWRHQLGGTLNVMVLF